MRTLHLLALNSPRISGWRQTSGIWCTFLLPTAQPWWYLSYGSHFCWYPLIQTYGRIEDLLNNSQYAEWGYLPTRTATRAVLCAPEVSAPTHNGLQRQSLLKLFSLFFFLQMYLLLYSQPVCFLKITHMFYQYLVLSKGLILLQDLFLWDFSVMQRC